MQHRALGSCSACLAQLQVVPSPSLLCHCSGLFRARATLGAHRCDVCTDVMCAHKGDVLTDMLKPH